MRLNFHKTYVIAVGFYVIHYVYVRPLGNHPPPVSIYSPAIRLPIRSTSFFTTHTHTHIYPLHLIFGLLPVNSFQYQSGTSRCLAFSFLFFFFIYVQTRYRTPRIAIRRQCVTPLFHFTRQRSIVE